LHFFITLNANLSNIKRISRGDDSHNMSEHDHNDFCGNIYGMRDGNDYHDGVYDICNVHVCQSNACDHNDTVPHMNDNDDDKALTLLTKQDSRKPC
jgi:hypothetical protein